MPKEKIVAQLIEQWRAYETILPGAADEMLHQARIAGKRMRYTLEFFADALGRNVEQVLAPLIDLQECLGALQDVVTARAREGAGPGGRRRRTGLPGGTRRGTCGIAG